MKMLMFGLAASLGVSASSVTAMEVVNVDGVEYPLSILTENCQSMSDEPQAMIACFNALSELIEDQSAGVEKEPVDVTQFLDTLRAAAEYEDNDTGLSIVGTDCSIQLVYYGNYFHLSRRNVSSIDLFSVEFDASKLQYDQIAQVPGAQVPLFQGMMQPGATAESRGGMALESTTHNFEPRSPRASLGAYASEVVDQLPALEEQAFQFVLVHPAKRRTSADIWNAFETFVKTCQS
jgi:hypothetical protein